MRFWKMSGAGNDFILLDDREDRLSPGQLSALARHLCRRRLSVGADGLMAAKPPQADGDVGMLFFNADGSQGEMCGNGARCICRWSYETGISGTAQRIETAAGPVTGQRIDRLHYRIRLNAPTVVDLRRPLSLPGWQDTISYIELGTPGLPHAVVPFPALSETPVETLRALGRSLRHHSAFPKGANVDLYALLPEGSALVRTYERGVEDFTLSCGTGAACVAATLILRGLVSGPKVVIQTPGGALQAEALCSGGTVTALYLQGPADMVCQGEIADEDLPV